MLIAKPWINHAITKSVKTKNRLYKQFYREKKQFKKDRIFEYFKTYRKHLVIIIRMSKEGYFKEYFDDNKKIQGYKKVWSAIRSIVNVKQTNRYQTSNLIIENKTFFSLSTTAYHFNYFFTYIAGDIDKTIGPSNKTPHDYLRRPNENSFYLSPTCK